MLKVHGAQITAICPGEHSELVKSLGATRTIDYLNQDFTQDHERYSFVFDTVGKSTFRKCRPLLEPGGAYLSSEAGPWIQNIFLAILTPLFGGKKVNFPFPTNLQASVTLVQQLTQQGKFQPRTDKTYPLEQISDAYHYVEQGQKLGNVVIKI